MKLPTEFRILGHTVLVERVKSTLFSIREGGECDADTGQIRIRMGLEPSIEDATILHEVIHFIDHHLDLGMSEEQVSGIGQGLFQFLADNEFMPRKK